MPISSDMRLAAVGSYGDLLRSARFTDHKCRRSDPGRRGAVPPPPAAGRSPWRSSARASTHSGCPADLHSGQPHRGIYSELALSQLATDTVSRAGSGLRIAGSDARPSCCPWARSSGFDTAPLPREPNLSTHVRCGTGCLGFESGIGWRWHYLIQSVRLSECDIWTFGWTPSAVSTMNGWKKGAAFAAKDGRALDRLYSALVG
jgi:hypothetical protein